MPRAHEHAAIDAATGARRKRLIEAALVLDRVRAENPDIDDPHHLRAPVRREALAALGVFRSGRRFGPPQVAVLLMLLAGSALIWGL